MEKRTTPNGQPILMPACRSALLEKALPLTDLHAPGRGEIITRRKSNPNLPGIGKRSIGMNGDNQTIRIGGTVALLCVFIIAGCNSRPDMPKTKWYGKPVKTLTVDSGDAEEVAEAEAVETTRKRYYHFLMMLSEYYDKTGNVTKGRWADRELANLTEAQDFTFVGITPPPDPQDVPTADAGERTLIENVTLARDDYLQALDDLAQFYEKKNDDFKARMVQTALARFFDEETYLYLHKVEVPPPTLEPCKIIPRANEMYDRALSLYQQGGRSFPTVDYPRQRQALGMFLRLVRKYPQSTRIASAAYYIGQIYAKYFDEPYLAVQWYQRAWTWDPYLPLPARYEAAVVCQEKLGEKRKALKLLHESLIHELPYEGNCKDAKERIKKLEEQIEYTPPIITPGEYDTAPPPPQTQPAE
jgi:tetratricopeptide (TPR) repeat protein